MTVIVLFRPIRNNLPVTHFECYSFLSCLWRAGQGSLWKKIGKILHFHFYSKGCIQNHRINEILKSTGKISCLRKIKHQFDAQTRGRKYAEIKKSVPRCTVEENGSLSKSSSFSSSLSCFPFLGDSQEPWQGLWREHHSLVHHSKCVWEAGRVGPVADMHAARPRCVLSCPGLVHGTWKQDEGSLDPSGRQRNTLAKWMCEPGECCQQACVKVWEYLSFPRFLMWLPQRSTLLLLQIENVLNETLVNGMLSFSFAAPQIPQHILIYIFNI